WPSGLACRRRQLAPQHRGMRRRPHTTQRLSGTAGTLAVARWVDRGKKDARRACTREWPLTAVRGSFSRNRPVGRSVRRRLKSAHRQTFPHDVTRTHDIASLTQGLAARPPPGMAAALPYNRWQMLRSLFILAILVPGLFASIRSRYAALVMYLWFALFRPQDWLWIDINRFRLSLVIGVLLLVPGLASGIVPNVTHPLSVGMIMFLLSALVAQAHAVNPAFGWVWVDF